MNASLRELLKQTSRSFYLTLRVLPGAIRPQICLAYLLARTTDTIADTEIVPVEQRLEALRKLSERILGRSDSSLDFSGLARHQGSPAERALLEQCEASIALLRELSAQDLQRVRQVLVTIAGGQELDLRRFAPVEMGSTAAPAVVRRALAPNVRAGDEPIDLPSRTAQPTTRASLAAPEVGALPNIIALQTDAELEDYTYRVAGCVGEFWTKMCRAHLFPEARLDDARLLADGIRFGKGLQLVNVLRDLPADLRKGRCYLPADKLAEVGLKPDDLLQPTNESRLRPLYNRYLDLAESHLAAGWVYTNTLPRGQVRVRLACAWPILIGMETLKRLRAESVLDAKRRIKINRADVRRLVVRSVIRYPWPGLWNKLVPPPASASGKAIASDANLT